MVRRHLSRVYGNLMVTSLLAALSAYTYTIGWLPRIDITLALLGLVALVGIMAVPSRYGLRHALLYTFGFIQGWSAGPLVQYYARIDPSGVLQAIVMAAALFAAFTGSALAVERRLYMYMAGVLSATTLVLSLMGLTTIFVGRLETMFMAQMFVGLFLFCGYVVYDTQIIIEQVEAGVDRDPVQHAAALFMNLFSIVLRLIVILNRGKGKDNGGRGSNSDSDDKGKGPAFDFGRSGHKSSSGPSRGMR